MHNQKKTIIISLGIVLALLTFYFAQQGLRAVSFAATTTNLTINISNSCTIDKYKLSFADQYNPMAELSVVSAPDTTTAFRDVVFKIPVNFKPTQIKISFGDCYSDVKIKSLKLTTGNSSVVWDAQTIFQNFIKRDSSTIFELKDGLACLKSVDEYPAIISKATSDILPIVCYENTWKPFWYAIMLSLLVYAIWHFIFFANFSPTTSQQTSAQLPKEKRIRYSSLGVTFIVLLLLPLLVFKVFEDPEAAAKAENRIKAGFPKMKVSTILNYTSGLNGFLNDNFGGRSFIIQGHALIHAGLFNVSTLRSRVEIGKNDRLFFVGEGVKEYSQNRHPLTEAQLQAMRKTLVENHEWLKLKGTKFYLIFPPIPQSIYEEDLPENLRKFSDVSKLRQLLTYLQQTTDLNIIEIHEPLQKAKKHLPLYLKEDTHWNETGGYVAYRQLHKTISRDFVIGEPYTSKNIKLATIDNGIGDLESMIGLPYISQNKQTLFLPPAEVLQEQIDSSAQVKAFAEGKGNALYWMSYQHKENNRLPKLLMYRDSYSGGFVRLFLNHFSQSTLVWNKKMNPAEVNYVKPDLVVFELLERFIPLLEKGNLPTVSEELKANGIVVDDHFFKQSNQPNAKNVTVSRGSQKHTTSVF